MDEKPFDFEAALSGLLAELRPDVKKAVSYGLLKCRVEHDDLEWMSGRVEPHVSCCVLLKLSHFLSDLSKACYIGNLNIEVEEAERDARREDLRKMLRR